jgi:hypothetical protein
MPGSIREPARNVNHRLRPARTRFYNSPTSAIQGATMITRVLGLGIASFIAVAFASPLASADVIFSEIMYDPASDERWPAKTEWLEIYNAGDQAVDLTGWHVQNENGRTQGLPEGATINPGEAIVLIPGNQTVEAFQAAWGEGFAVFPLDGWHNPGLRQLTNSPGEERGVLTLRNADGDLIDEVNYNNTDPWPPNRPHGPSIYVLPEHLSTAGNDDGGNWRRSEPGVDGARRANATEDYSADDVGSPGHVERP